METLKKVCGVMDMQGYFLNNKFYPRELCLCNEELDIFVEINCDLDVDDLKNHKLLNNYKFQKFLIHGIPLESIRGKLGLKVVSYKELENVITSIYEKVKTEDKYILACKNQQLSKILRNLLIPFINLETTKIEDSVCPKLEQLDDNIGKGLVWFCPLHTCLPNDEKTRKTLRCSLRKSRYIWVWLQGKIVIHKVFQQIRSLHEDTVF
jgi:hypothetical protein